MQDEDPDVNILIKEEHFEEVVRLVKKQNIIKK